MEEIYGKWDDSFIQVGALREGIMSLNRIELYKRVIHKFL